MGRLSYLVVFTTFHWPSVTLLRLSLLNRQGPFFFDRRGSFDVLAKICIVWLLSQRRFRYGGTRIGTSRLNNKFCSFYEDIDFFACELTLKGRSSLKALRGSLIKSRLIRIVFVVACG